MTLLLLLPFDVSAADWRGENLSLLWGVPFAGILLSLSLFPLIFKNFWHKHYGKIIGGWTCLFLVPALFTAAPVVCADVAHIIIKEYIPFMAMTLALFTVTGGIRVKSTWIGSPAGNAGILFIGTVLASMIGTTGASMVLIRPMIQANAWRAYKTHIFIFYIFLVANVGGSLSPLGDAPLFIGFLEGVPFSWPLINLAGPTLLIASYLIILFFVVDSFYFKKEKATSPHIDTKRQVKINGKINLIFLCTAISILVGTTIIKTELHVNILGTKWLVEDILRDLSFLFIAVLSIKLTKKNVRHYNHFSWEPLLEVGKVFAGIFITMLPILSILKAGGEGALAPVISKVMANGVPDNNMFFWITGLFSSFLDNAPSYLIFFFVAGGDVAELITTLKTTLISISMGSVYMGAMTYIGNAPNFMVRSMAEQQGIEMPNFFSYILIASIVLLPIFFLASRIFLS